MTVSRGFVTQKLSHVKLTALILGHSYTRRLRGEALGHPYYRKHEDVSNEDTAKTLAAKLIINKKIDKIII